MINDFLNRILKAKTNSEIIDVILDIYLQTKQNPNLSKEFDSLLKYRCDDYIILNKNILNKKQPILKLIK